MKIEEIAWHLADNSCIFGDGIHPCPEEEPTPQTCVDCAVAQINQLFEKEKQEIIALLGRLLEAAKAGECPDPDCAICKRKQATIKEAEQAFNPTP